MSDDLVKRLRFRSATTSVDDRAICYEAADEIERLRSLLRDCLPELDGEGVTIHRVWAALGCKNG